MDVGKIPASVPGLAAVGLPGAQAPPGAAVPSGLPLPLPLAPAVDLLHIQPLDLVAALQIIAVEVRSDLQLPAVTAAMQDAAQAPHVLVQMLLAALPENVADLPAWTAASAETVQVFFAAVDRAVATVAAWHQVPQTVVDAAKDVRSTLIGLVADEPVSVLWARPEWLGLAPQMRRFWRRRRAARRQLTDPDYAPEHLLDDRLDELL